MSNINDNMDREVASRFSEFKDYEDFKNPRSSSGKCLSSGFDNLKDFLDYYYIIPKCQGYSEDDLLFFNRKRVYFNSFDELNGQPFLKRKTKKKRFTPEEAAEIKRLNKEEKISYKELSYRYKCSKATLYEIIHDKY